MELKITSLEKELLDLKAGKGTAEQVRMLPARRSLTKVRNARGSLEFSKCQCSQSLGSAGAVREGEELGGGAPALGTGSGGDPAQQPEGSG